MEARIITAQGESMLARQLAGEILSFTSVKIGRGALIETDVPYNFTAVKELVKSVPIAEPVAVSSENSNIAILKAIYSNEGFLTATNLIEYGIYAKIGDEEEQLYCYINIPEFIPAYSTYTFVNKVKKFNIEVGTAESVQMKVNEEEVYVTLAQFKRESTNAFQAAMASRMFG